MITRMIYRAEFQAGQVSTGVKALESSEQAEQRVIQGELMTAAAYVWRNSLFLYYECIDGQLSPDGIAGAAVPYLKDWPGQSEPRKWIPMIDVFHFNEPADREHWLRKKRVEKRVGRVAHLKPEMISSYIYYHYQLQEERSFTGDKYEIIAMHENLLFGYQEFPKVIEEPVVPGRLKTKGTPENWQDSRMDLHFQPWEEDGYLYFKPIEPIFAYYIGDYK
ncbi:hypothetical protein P5G65_19110 [Paenibacillus chondroitinus]|uniref:Uncharacterized protein n=1 Tax=Paenibacillus chondroitinus TaxID=59842 RepID=A0ABU6DE26_9BACL|nr:MULTISPECIES: hypothetical protein [Paenibacillus]MCY9658758.1 hypothetical protein [Paenibacillus anseongense]MEB4796016.1 hypothetical protein [Paenibacillus chondroitinus]